jgi:hypothetical protein
MPTPILMPALSPTMTEGNLARWLMQEGDKDQQEKRKRKHGDDEDRGYNEVGAE